MVDTSTPAGPGEKPFFKKMRFWVHLSFTVGCLILGQIRAWQSEGREETPVANPVHVPAPAVTGEPTVWSLQVQTTGLDARLKEEIDDRKVLAAIQEKNREENLAAINEIKSDVKEILRFERERPKAVSLGR